MTYLPLDQQAILSHIDLSDLVDESETGQLSDIEILIYTATTGTDILHQNTKESSTSSTTFVTAATITLDTLPSSTMKFAWEYRTGSGSNVESKILINGVIAGAVRDSGSSGYVTTTETVAGLSIGDVITLQFREPAVSSGDVYVKNLRIIGTVTTSKLNLTDG